MTPKRYYMTLGSIVVITVGVSVAFFPAKSDTPLMFYYDKQYEKAYDLYRTLYDEGDRSISVVIPLVKILLEYSKTDEAIAIMKEYVAAHPESPDSLQFLAKIYRNTNRIYDYLRTLETLYALDPSVDVLREKEKYYGYVGDTKNEVEVLETLVHHYHPSEGEYLELAFRYAKDGDKVKAADIMDQFLAKFPLKNMDSSTVEFAIDILAEQKRSDQAIQLAFEYQKLHPNFQETLVMVSALQKWGFNQAGRDLLMLMPHKSRKSPQYASAYVSLLIADHLNYLAYDYLRNYLVFNEVPRSLLKDLLALSTDFQDYHLLKIVLSSNAIGSVPEAVLMRVVNQSAVNGQFDVIRVLESELGESYLKNRQGLAFALMLADPTIAKDESRFLVQYYDLDSLSLGNKALIAKMAFDVGQRQLSNNILDQINDFNGIPYDDIDGLANLYIEAGRAKKGWKLINDLRELNRGGAELDRPWVLLGVGAGEDDVVIQWLKGHSKVDSALLKDAFYVAYQQKNASLSMHLANALYSVEPTKKNQILIAEALVLNGQLEQAYELFDELLASGEDVSEPYVTVLAMLAKGDVKFRAKLEVVVADLIETKKLSDSALFSLAYVMIDYEMKDEAQKMFLQVANGKPFDSKEVQGLLWMWGDKPSATVVDWVVKRVGAGDFSDGLVNNFREGTASSFAENLSNKSIDNSFYSLANNLQNDIQNNLANSPENDLQNNPQDTFANAPQNDLQNDLENDIQNNPQDTFANVPQNDPRNTFTEKYKWLNYLYGLEQYQVVIQNITPQDWTNSDLADLYLEAIVVEKQNERLNDLIAYVIPQESRLPRLKRYGKLAFDYGLRTAADTIYQKILMIEPNDQDALVNLGEMAFNCGAYCEAENYFLKAIESEKTSYRPYYLLGEIYEITHRPWYARACRYEAYCLLGLKGDTSFSPNEIVTLTPYEQSIKASLLYRLHYVSAAIAEYEDLLLRDPETIYYRIDYANLLIDLECYRSAYQLLFCGVGSVGVPKNNEEKESLILARARYYKQRFQFAKAYCEIAKLEEGQEVKSNNPDKKFAALADLSLSVGRWRESLCHLDEAQSLASENEGYSILKCDIWESRLPEIQLGTEYRVTGDDQLETFARFQGSRYLQPFTLMTLLAEVDHIDVNQYPSTTNGVLETVDTVRYRTELDLKHTLFSGDEVISSLYYAPHVLGGSVGYRHLDSSGISFLTLEYHHPNWDFTQTTIDYGSRDMVALSRVQRLHPRLDGNIIVSYNQYNLRGLEKAATSYAIEGGLVCKLPICYSLARCLPFVPVMTLNYAVDSEFKTSIKERKDVYGGTFDPLPLIDREVHSWTAFWSARLARYLTFDLYGGCSYDFKATIGKINPVYGTNVFIGKHDWAELHFTYSHSTSTETTSQAVDRFVLDFTFRW